MWISILFELGVLLILGLCIWNGYSKGLFMSVAGIVILLVSIVIGAVFASYLSPVLADTVGPYIDWLSEDAAEYANQENFDKNEPVGPNSMENAVKQAFEYFGMSSGAVDNLSRDAMNLVNDSKESITTAVSHVFTRTVTYILIFIVIFALSAMILSLIANMINSALKFPVIHLFNKMGGIIIGGVYGILLVSIAAWILRFAGGALPEGTLENTILTKFFMSANVISLMLGY